MTVTTIMVPGVIYEDTTSLALDLSLHYPAVPATLPVQATAVHIVIKQGYDALEVLGEHAPKLETCDCLVEIMKMKEL